MKKLKLEELIPGMVTAEDVYNYNDQLILPIGLVLSSKAISKLQFYGIYQVRVEDELAPVEEASSQTPPENIQGTLPEKPAAPVQPVSQQAPVPVQSVPQADSMPAQPVSQADSVPAQPIPQTDSVPAQPVSQADSVPVQPVPQAPSAPAQPVPQTAPVPAQPVSQTASAPNQPTPEKVPRWEPIHVSKNTSVPTFSNSSSSSVSYMDKLKASQEFTRFKQTFNEEVQDFKSKINEVVLKNVPLDVDELLDDALKLVAQGRGSFSIFDMLHSMRQNDDETYAHCLNVGLFCNVFGGWLKLKEEEIRLATLCGLLHDVGKMKLPEALLKKPGVYTEEELWAAKKHTYEGYQLVKNLDIDNHVKNAVLTHHERCDGSGYPFGLRDMKIDPYAKMVAIADVYDAMTSARPYRDAMSPIQAVEIMRQEGLQKYDVGFILIFLENVMNTFIGNRVLLSTGETGEIVYIHKDNVTRPTVKCGGHYVDMNKDKSVQIVAML